MVLKISDGGCDYDFVHYACDTTMKQLFHFESEISVQVIHI